MTTTADKIKAKIADKIKAKIADLHSQGIDELRRMLDEHEPLDKEVGEQEDGWPGGDIVTYECPNCGTRWKQELPQ